MDAPNRSNSVQTARLAHAQLIREIEVDLSSAEDTLNTLKKPERPDGKLGYDAASRKFTPRGGLISKIFGTGHTCHEVTDGLKLLDALLCELYNKVRILPNTHEYASIRNAQRLRMIQLADVIRNVAGPCLQHMIEQYQKTPKDRESIQTITEHTQNIQRSISKTSELLTASVDENPLLQSVLPDYDSSIVQIVPLKKGPIPSAMKGATYLLNGHEENVEYLQNVKANPNQLLVIPSQLINRCFNEIKALKENHCSKDELKQAIVIKTNEARKFDKCASLVSPGNNRWKSLQIQEFANKIHILPGAVTPTSERDTHDTNNHLVNFKVDVDQVDGQVVVTCGVINTQRKANEFIKGLEIHLAERNKQGPKHKLRIVFHQLNSFQTSEGNYITSQNLMTNYIEDYFKKKLSDGSYCHEMHIEPSNEPLLSHVNLALNAAVTFYGYVEDSYSHSQNMEGLAAQCIWLMNDFKHIPAFQTEHAKAVLAKLTQARKEIIDYKQRQATGDDIFDYLTHSQSEMNDCLYEAAKLFMTIRAGIDIAVDNDDKIEFEDIRNEKSSSTSTLNAAEGLLVQSRLFVMSRILGAQVLSDATNRLFRRKFAEDVLEFAPLERMEELELHLLNDMISQAIGEMNCKSGLDRTGIARAIKDAQKTTYKRFYSEHLAINNGDRALASSLAIDSLIKLIVDQKKYIKELDLMMNEIVKDHKVKIVTDIKHFNDAATLEAQKIDFMAVLQEKIKAKYKTAPECKAIMDAFNYQNLIGADIFNVAQIVTMESTGVPGMKWGKNYGMTDLGANPFPPMRLPRFALSDDGKIVQLVTDKNILTDAGVQLIIRWGNLRGE